MKFSKLIKDLECEKLTEDKDVEISGLATDPDMVSEGDLFIAYKGANFDLNEHIQTAIKNGAVAVVCERNEVEYLPCAVVKDGRRAVARLARSFYGYADKKLKIIAVTGTNGKTTTCHMLKSIFDENGNKTAIVGTLGIAYGDIFIAPELTTPDPICMHGIFADMVASGVEYVFMEVSAHALYFDKLLGVHFNAGVFTNCTQDHLDFFNDMQSYENAKLKLFEGDLCERMIVNADDNLGAKIIKSKKNVITYGLENPSDCFAVNIVDGLSGSSFVINLFDELYDVSLNMPAKCNVYNALAAATCARVLGVKLEVIAKGLSNLKSVSGRLERVAKYNGGQVFVDFAHTPDGLEKSLSSLKELCKGNLYCVFGCGGNRDRGKRPLMGEIAARIADFVVITSDNPRYEDPYSIISQIEEGVRKVKGKYVAVTDREIAIEYSLNLLEKDDILLIAGKGGENYQEIMGVKHSYNDGAVIKKLIG